MVDANVAGRDGNAEAGFLIILEFVENHDVVFKRGARVLAIVVIVVLAVDDEDFFYGDAGAGQKTDLLGFLVFHGGAAAEPVQERPWP